MVQLLCEAGANVNVEDRWGNRPLDDAQTATQSSGAMVKILEQYGAKPSDKAIQNLSDNSLQTEIIEDPDVLGTPAYWPPEMFSKGATPTPAVDMWAAGVVVYILLTGS